MNISYIIIAFFICTVFIVAVVRKVDILTAFIDGAKQGLYSLYGILPSLVFVVTSVAVFRAAGGFDLLVTLLTPAAELIGLPAQTLPLAVIKPFSGSGSTALLEDLISIYGADSRAGLVGAVIASSTETTFYTISVYLCGMSGSCGRIICAATMGYIVSVIVAAVIV